MSKRITLYYVGLHILVFLLFLSFVFLAVPSTDDYAYAVNSMNNSVWEAVAGVFSGWGSRYTQTFISTLWYKLDLLVGIPYSVGLIMYILLLFAGIYSFLGIFFKDSADKRKRLLLALVFLTGIIRSLPTLDESIYWNIGGTTYLLPAALFLCFLSLLHKSYVDRREWSFQPLLILLILFIDGISESFVVLNILVAFGVIVYSYLGGCGRKAYVLTLLVGVGGLLLMLSSSGNSVRMNVYPESGQLLYSLFWGSIAGTQAIIQAVADPYIWGSILLFLPFLKDVREKLPIGMCSKRAGFVFLITFIVMLYSIVAIHYYATGNRPVQRLMVVWYIIFYMGMFCLAVWLVPQISKIYEFLYNLFNRLLRRKISPRLILTVLVFAAFLLINNPPKAVYDLVYNIPGFIEENREFQTSIQHLQDSREKPKVLIIEKFKHRPLLLKAPTDANYGMTEYFGIDEIRIVDKKE